MPTWTTALLEDYFLMRAASFPSMSSWETQWQEVKLQRVRPAFSFWAVQRFCFAASVQVERRTGSPGVLLLAGEWLPQDDGQQMCLARGHFSAQIVEREPAPASIWQVAGWQILPYRRRAAGCLSPSWIGQCRRLHDGLDALSCTKEQRKFYRWVMIWSQTLKKAKIQNLYYKTEDLLDLENVLDTNKKRERERDQITVCLSAQTGICIGWVSSTSVQRTNTHC